MHHPSRLAARLALLPHAVLAELCALACDAPADDSRRAADAALALHSPLDCNLVDEVLLSPDLLPRLMAKLEVEDAPAAAVCTGWRQAFVATRKFRRKLHPAIVGQPDFELLRPRAFAALPDDKRLTIESEGRLHVVDRRMRHLQTICEADSTAGDIDSIVASNDGLFVSERNPARLRRLHPETFELLAVYSACEYSGFCTMVAAPGQFLFAAADVSIDGSNEIVKLDSLLFELDHAFGRDLLSADCLRGMTVVGQELFVGDRARRCVHVFSFDGEHLREVRGDWGTPRSLCFAEGRLYLTEVRTYGVEGPGHRIFSLTPEGETLQIYTPDQQTLPAEDTICSMCAFDGRLILCSDLRLGSQRSSERGQPGRRKLWGGPSVWLYRLFALQGL